MRQLVERQFPHWRGLAVREVVSGGWDNRTFHLGDDLLVRLPRHKAYASQVDKEQRWLPYLAPHVPIPIPSPVGLGEPDAAYPFRWSVYRWLPGDMAAESAIGDEASFGADLAGFLSALQRTPAAGGPRPGRHNFMRGGSLTVYDLQTRQALELLPHGTERERSIEVWEAALLAEWDGVPVWFHGDFTAANLLVQGGRLCAVIDFGNLGVGDPACDLAIAWTFLGAHGRGAFKAGLTLDEPTWARARGWTLWKALILHTGLVEGHARDMARARQVLESLLAD